MNMMKVDCRPCCSRFYSFWIFEMKHFLNNEREECFMGQTKQYLNQLVNEHVKKKLMFQS